jgi:hypothetical protein
LFNVNMPFFVKVIVWAIVAGFFFLLGRGTLSAPSLENSGGQHVVTDMSTLGLATARDDAKRRGVTLLPYDSSGQGRKVDHDRDWMICFQSPSTPAAYSVRVQAVVGVVKADEDCPTTDEGVATPVVDGLMPPLSGESVTKVRLVLGDRASIVLKDRKGHKHEIDDDDTQVWKVCRQSPTQGDEYHGQPVNLTIDKRC